MENLLKTVSFQGLILKRRFCSKLNAFMRPRANRWWTKPISLTTCRRQISSTKRRNRESSLWLHGMWAKKFWRLTGKRCSSSLRVNFSTRAMVSTNSWKSRESMTSNCSLSFSRRTHSVLSLSENSSSNSLLHRVKKHWSLLSLEMPMERYWVWKRYYRKVKSLKSW